MSQIRFDGLRHVSNDIEGRALLNLRRRFGVVNYVVVNYASLEEERF